jgi:hypothetical protein
LTFWLYAWFLYRKDYPIRLTHQNRVDMFTAYVWSYGDIISYNAFNINNRKRVCQALSSSSRLPLLYWITYNFFLLKTHSLLRRAGESLSHRGEQYAFITYWDSKLHSIVKLLKDRKILWFFWINLLLLWIRRNIGWYMIHGHFQVSNSNEKRKIKQ